MAICIPQPNQYSILSYGRYAVRSWIADADGRMHDAASADEKRLRLEGVPAEEARGVRVAQEAGGALGYWRWRAEQQSGTNRPNHVDNAHVLAHLGHMDDAFRELETALRERDASLVMLQIAPWFDAFRADPKFEGLLRRMNFPD